MRAGLQRGVFWFGIGLVLYTIMVFGFITLTTYLTGPLQQYTTVYAGCLLLQTLPPEFLAAIIVLGATSLGIMGYLEE
jgi:hypothetical protein